MWIWKLFKLNSVLRFLREESLNSQGIQIFLMEYVHCTHTLRNLCVRDPHHVSQVVVGAQHVERVQHEEARVRADHVLQLTGREAAVAIQRQNEPLKRWMIWWIFRQNSESPISAIKRILFISKNITYLNRMIADTCHGNLDLIMLKNKTTITYL